MTLDLGVVAGRLLREAGLDARPQRGGSGRAWPALAGLRLAVVAVGWATVDLERARVAFRPSAPSGQDRPPSQPAAAVVPDDLLGAEARLVGHPLDRPGLVLLEPSTEGRLAASLARRGEGPAVLYLAPVGVTLGSGLEHLAAAGIRTRLGRGPFGEAALVLGGSSGGPQLVLVAVPSGP